MSGGSLDYVYVTVEEAANEINKSKNRERRVFAKLLFKVSKALHDIEWVDSGDYGEGEEIESMKACYVNEKEETIKFMLEEAKALKKELEEILNTHNK